MHTFLRDGDPPLGFKYYQNNWEHFLFGGGGSTPSPSIGEFSPFIILMPPLFFEIFGGQTDQQTDLGIKAPS